ncbi:MAG: TrbI/VirB10 family protein [Bdellovibrionales bacterium]|nr:TrbI/VirB10 family protein [Bdellovibrionales bacterium]
MKNHVLFRKLRASLNAAWKRLVRCFVCEVELGGQKLRGLEYRNIGVAVSSVAVMGIVAVALYSGFTFTGMARWMGFLPQEARSATLDTAQEAKSNTSDHAPQRKTASRTDHFNLEIVESRAEGSFGRLDRGAFLLGILKNRIVSEQENTPVLVKLPQGAMSRGRMIVPPDSLIIGTTQGRSERRVFVGFHTLRSPDGQAYPIKAQLLSPDGSAGLSGEYSSGRGKAVAGAAISAFVSGAASGLMTFQAGPLGTVSDGSVRNSMLSGLAGTANFAADTYTADMRNARGVVEAEPDSLVLIMLDEDFRTEVSK